MRIPDPEEIRKARLELQMTQEDAASVCGASPSEWERWESPVWSDQYDVILGTAWDKFLLETAHLRNENSEFWINPSRLRSLKP